jgi:hypothetical protein
VAAEDLDIEQPQRIASSAQRSMNVPIASTTWRHRSSVKPLGAGIVWSVE